MVIDFFEKKNNKINNNISIMKSGGSGQLSHSPQGPAHDK